MHGLTGRPIWLFIGGLVLAQGESGCGKPPPGLAERLGGTGENERHFIRIRLQISAVREICFCE